MDKSFIKARLLWIFPLVATFFLTRFLLSATGDKSEAFSAVQWLCIFVQVGLFFSAVWGWGGLITKSVQTANSTLEKILLGILVFIGWMWLAGTIGFLGEKFSWIHICFLLVGLSVPTFSNISKIESRNLDRKVLTALLPVILFFGISVLQAMQMQVIEDVFSYHLYAPQRWWLDGKISFDSHYPHLYMASYWEMLYLWAYPIFPANSLQSVSVYVFAQLIHVLLGLMGSFFLLFRLFRGSSVKPEWSMLAALFGVSLFPLLWTSWHAKNDYGALLFCLGAVYFLFERKVFRAGLFIGVSVAAKLSAIFSLTAIPVLLVIFFRQRFSLGNTKHWLLLLLGISLAIFPLLLRNFLATGNPVFPFLVEQLSPGVTTATMNQVIYSVLGNRSESGNDFSFVFLVQFIREPLLVVSLVIVLLGFWKKADIRILSLATIALVPVAAASLWLGKWLLDSIFVRYVALSLVLANSLPFAILDKWVIAGKKNFVQWCTLVAVIVLWFITKPFLPWAALRELPRPGTFYSGYMTGVSGIKCRDWLSANVLPSELIVSIEDDYLYFMEGAKVRVAAHDPEIDPLVRGASDLSYLPTVQKLGAKYVFHVRRESGRTFYKNSAEIHQSLNAHQGKVVGDDECVVVKL